MWQFAPHHRVLTTCACALHGLWFIDNTIVLLILRTQSSECRPATASGGIGGSGRGHSMVVPCGIVPQHPTHGDLQLLCRVPCLRALGPEHCACWLGDLCMQFVGADAARLHSGLCLLAVRLVLLLRAWGPCSPSWLACAGCTGGWMPVCLCACVSEPLVIATDSFFHCDPGTQSLFAV